MDLTFCELRAKDVINVVDGKRLGHIVDIVFNCRNGRIQGLVLPPYKKTFSLFKSSEDIFVPYNQICKIGADVILVELFFDNPCGCKPRVCNAETMNIDLNKNDFNLNDYNNT